MKTFIGLGRKFVPFHYSQTGSSVYLNIRRISLPIKKDYVNDDKSKITKLAINVEGGFHTEENKSDQRECNAIFLMPDFTEISLESPILPDKVIMSVSAILSADSALKKDEIESMKNTWDGEKRVVSKHSESLVQLNNGVTISPSGWKCEKCDITEGLWLNLTDGSILCGRKYFDGTGGNNHASEHYVQTKYPLVVKLGTITPNTADIYSYDEDSMVEDPNLDKHLAHFGINISNCKKTEKSMIEMEIDLNKRFDEWSIIQEDGLELCPLFGPGFTGMANLGNSCYLNSVMQMLFSIPNFANEYYISDKKCQYDKSNRQNPFGDLRTQLMKLASGLLSGEYSLFSQNLNEQVGLRPQVFKNLISRNHQEFMSKRQQDAQEFLLYVIEKIERMHQEEGKLPSPGDCFKFEIEQRVQCGSSSKVKYSTRCESHLSLSVTNVPLQNQEEYNRFLILKENAEKNGEKIESSQTVHPIIKLTDCINNFTGNVCIDDFFSSAINGKTFATMSSRFRTFPDYLLIQLKKFTLNQNWVPIKLDVSMEVPDFLDIECFRAKGIQPDEVELPENVDDVKPKEEDRKVQFNQDYLKQLTDMGFDINACKRALYNTNNESLEQATSWLLEYFDDPSMSEPFTYPNENQSENSLIQVEVEALKKLQDMGIIEKHARLALQLNNNDTQRAIEWYFCNEHRMDLAELELEEMKRNNLTRTSTTTTETASTINQQSSLTDGNGQYELVGFISHMGTSTFCGHYVVHLKKSIPNENMVKKADRNKQLSAVMQQDNAQQWVIFNDNKVAVSERPPKQFAYIYLYRRCKMDK